MAPADLNGDLDVYIWAADDAGAGNETWSWDAWVAASGVAWSEQSGSELIDWSDGRPRGYLYRDAVDSITASAGDLVHMRIYGPSAALRLMGVEFAYTGDS